MNLYDKIGTLMDAGAELGCVTEVHAVDGKVEVLGKGKDGMQFHLTLEVD